jgi:hypothetical protein
MRSQLMRGRPGKVACSKRDVTARAEMCELYLDCWCYGSSGSMTGLRACW